MNNFSKDIIMKVGDIYQEEIKITTTLIEKFAEFSGDYNPVHFEDSKAQAQGFKGRISHGMVSASFFSMSRTRFSMRLVSSASSLGESGLSFLAIKRRMRLPL